MDILLVFAGTLLAAALISELASRSVLSVSALFLLAGFLFEKEVLGVITVTPDDPLVTNLAEFALFGVLFTDGMQLAWSDLRKAWRLPGRALLLGMPLTMILFAGAARWIVGFSWTEALLVGAILSPTDPVFASAIIGRASVPAKLRHLLHVESGMNDGLALPAVIVFLEIVSAGELHPLELLGEVVGGIAIGVAIPWAAIKLEASRFFASYAKYHPLGVFAVGLLILALCSVTGMNEFLAAFSAGVTIASISPESRESFHEFGELVAELLKLAALLLFGALISPEFLVETPWFDYVFAAVALLAVRPIALGIALLGSGMHWKQRLAASWFGPRGFASVVYGLMLFRYDIPAESRASMYHVIALVVSFSILAHSSTDVLIARWLEVRKSNGDDESRPEEKSIESDPGSSNEPPFEAT